MTDEVVREEDDGFVMPLADFVCTDWEDDGWLVVRDESGNEGRIGLETDEHRALALALVARRARVERVIATREGILVAEFDEGVSLRVAPANEVEAWEVRGPGDVNVVCRPGGGEPAIWESNSPTFTIRPGEPLPPEFADKFGHWFEQPEGERE